MTGEHVPRYTATSLTAPHGQPRARPWASADNEVSRRWPAAWTLPGSSSTTTDPHGGRGLPLVSSPAPPIREVPSNQPMHIPERSHAGYAAGISAGCPRTESSPRVASPSIRSANHATSPSNGWRASRQPTSSWPTRPITPRGHRVGPTEPQSRAGMGLEGLEFAAERCKQALPPPRGPPGHGHHAGVGGPGEAEFSGSPAGARSHRRRDRRSVPSGVDGVLDIEG